MAAVTDLSDLVNRMTGGNSGTPEFPFLFIDQRIGAAAATAPVAGRFSSMWRYNNTQGGGGAIPPTTAAAPTRATQGALPFTNPGGGRQKWRTGFAFASCFGASGIVTLYDRLLHISGLSGTSISAQTVGGSLTRYASGSASVGNQIWIEINTIIGTTGTTITASYTNQAGTSGRTTQAAPIGATNAREAERMIPLPLQDGDTGVQEVASVTLAGTTGTAGDFGVVIVRPLSSISLQNVGAWTTDDAISGMPGMPEILTDACLALMYLSGSATAMGGWLSYGMVEA